MLVQHSLRPFLCFRYTVKTITNFSKQQLS